MGGRLYVAGQVPHDRSGLLVGIGDPAEQCRQCLRNLLTLVLHHGFALADIHRLTIYVVGDRVALGRAWDAVVDLFDGSVPPATLLGVAVLGHEHQLVEIDAEIDREPVPLNARLGSGWWFGSGCGSGGCSGCDFGAVGADGVPSAGGIAPGVEAVVLEPVVMVAENARVRG